MWQLLLLLVGVARTHAFVFGKDHECYGKYGCFYNTAPYDNTGKVPDSPEHIGTEFLLYTKQNMHSAQHLHDGDTHSVLSSHFNVHHGTKFLIHGYQSTGHSGWPQSMKNAILAADNVNVIVVSWEDGAAKLNYKQAAANTRVVGAVIAELIKTLYSMGASYSSIHLIGHSLGSHIAGYAGERINKVGRITGLDPAGPLFEHKSPDVRLDPSDATFVDAIHTDAETLLHLGFGLEQRVADVDFYPNGGYDQPGCPANIGGHLVDLITGSLEKLASGVACSHMRAPELFSATISSPCVFRGVPCSAGADFKKGHCHSCGSGCVEKLASGVACSHMRAPELFSATISSPCVFRGVPCSAGADFKKGHCHSCGSGCVDMGYHMNTHSRHGAYYFSTTRNHPFC